MARFEKPLIRRSYQVVVVGGGLSGLCAALACARHGAATALVHNRPMLGGNASSEVRMHICGADYHASRPEARETGIIEEILLDNRRCNPSHSFSLFDTVLWEKASFQENLDLYLNTHFTEAAMDGPAIRSIRAEQLTTEKLFELEAGLFVDASGDAILAVMAGAEAMRGREGRDVFAEPHAPQQSDPCTMGNSLLFRAVDLGRPVPFRRPAWAERYSEQDLAHRLHGEISSGYWWVELGGQNDDVIADGEKIRDDLLKAVYGIWDHIKNTGSHHAETWALDWIGFLPGKRESRRIVGDYVLVEQDLMAGRVFEDAVAYGGWPMDVHVPGGLASRGDPPNQFIELPGLYTIPYRCLYARDLANLFVCGRIVSASHLAMSSMRVMATCSLTGQAAGTAAAMAAAAGAPPGQVRVEELQRRLRRDDCYLPGLHSRDPADFAPEASVSGSSHEPGGEPANLVNGCPRRTGGSSNCWISRPLGRAGEWVALDFGREITASQVDLRFDSNLSREIMPSLSEQTQAEQVPGIPPELVRDYAVELFRGDQAVHRQEVRDNHQRHRVHRLPDALGCDRLRLQVNRTNGDRRARIFEVRVY